MFGMFCIPVMTELHITKHWGGILLLWLSYISGKLMMIQCKKKNMKFKAQEIYMYTFNSFLYCKFSFLQTMTQGRSKHMDTTITVWYHMFLSLKRSCEDRYTCVVHCYVRRELDIEYRVQKARTNFTNLVIPLSTFWAHFILWKEHGLTLWSWPCCLWCEVRVCQWCDTSSATRCAWPKSLEAVFTRRSWNLK